MKLTVLITSADLPEFLKETSDRDIQTRRIIKKDHISATMEISAYDLTTIRMIAAKRGDECALVKGSSITEMLRTIKSRWLMILISLLLLFLSVMLPERVYFIRVEGNAGVSDEKILLAAEKCGIYFGADRRPLRSVKVKNALLELMPELGWACINTSGCVATIRVTEKNEAYESNAGAFLASGIYALKDGIVQSVTVYSGESKVSVGQAVKRGQLLVDGNITEGNITKLGRAAADVYGTTVLDVTAAIMTEAERLGGVVESHSVYSLVIGKKLINLSKDSRICTAGCVKIYEQENITLPGGFVLPLGIAKESCLCYDTASANDVHREDMQLAEAYMESYVLEQTIAGRIIQKVNLQFPQPKDNQVAVRFHCLEIIGGERSEELESSYGKND